MPESHGLPPSRGRGAAMLLVMIALVLSAVLAITFLARQAPSSAIAKNVEHHAVARAIAESALTSAMAYVREDDGWREAQVHGYWTPEAGLYGGTFRVVFEDEDGDLADDVSDPFIITVAAWRDGASHQVSAYVVPSVAAAEQLLLLVVPSAGSLSAEDQARKAKFESWGYVVSLASATDTSAALAAAISSVNVAYVSGTVSPNTLSQKMRSLTKGVVWERTESTDDFGLTTAGGSNADANAIIISDTSHDITSIFPAGLMTLSESLAVSLQQAGGAVIADARVLATYGGSQAVLIAADVRATLSDGSALLGRRVALPVGGPGFSISDLSADGQTLLRRSLQWAAQQPTPLEPIAHWRFDEISGLTAYDSAADNDGTYTNGPTLARTGTMSKSVEFDGATQYIVVENPDAALNLTSTLTFAAWLWPDQWTGNRRILQKGNQDNQYRLLSEWGNFVFELSGVGRLETAHPPAGAWTHISATYDGSRMRIYYNGIEVASMAATGSVNTSNDALYLGTKNPWAPDYDHFDGRMDDLRIYDYALTPTEIDWLYLQGDTVEDNISPDLIALYEFVEQPNTPQLVAHWKLDESSGMGGGIAAADKVTLENNSRIDAYDSRDGVYSLAGSGADIAVTSNTTANGTFTITGAAVLAADAFVGAGGSANLSFYVDGAAKVLGSKDVQLVNVSIPDQGPSGLSSSASDATIAIDTTWDADRRYRNLTVTNNAIVTVVGHVTIDVTRSFDFSGGAIVLSSGSSLTLYVGQNLTLSNSAALNDNSMAPDRVTIRLYGGSSYTMRMQDKSRVAAMVYVDGDLTIEDTAVLYGGAVVGDDLTLLNDGEVHVDRALSSLRGPEISPAVGSITGALVHGSVAQPGKIGSSFGFDGSDDFAALYHHASLLLESGSLVFWVYPQSTSGTQGLVSKDSAGYDTGGQFTVKLVGGQLQAGLESATASYTVASGSSAVAANQWQHVVMSWGADGLLLYLNGTLVDQQAYYGGLDSSSGGIGNYEPIVFGADAGGSDDKAVTPLSHYFHGRLDDVRFYDRGLNADQVANLYALAAPGDGPSNQVVDTGGWGQPLDLKIADTTRTTWVSGGGLRIDEPVVIQSSLPATKVCDELTETDQLTLDVIFTTDDVLQSGPAGIVSISGGNTSRNITLGQDETAYSVRLRTANNSSNGTSPEVLSAAVLTAGQQQQVLISYDGQKVDVYRNGKLETTEPMTGSLNWDSSYPLIFGGELGGGRSWTGTLQRVAIYNRAVNPLQAKNIFNGLLPGPPLPETIDFKYEWRERP